MCVVAVIGQEYSGSKLARRVVFSKFVLTLSEILYFPFLSLFPPRRVKTFGIPK